MRRESWYDYFGSNEKLLWEGAPEPLGLPGIGGILLSVFGMPFFGVGSFILFTALTGGAVPDESGSFEWTGIWLFLFGTPFFLVGATLFLGPWLYYATAHKFLRYALSNRATYVANSFLGRRMKVYPLDHIGEVELEFGRHDSVFFHKSLQKDNGGDTVETRAGFENIRDGRHVYDLIRKWQKDLTA
ncbi:MAG: hypothetical protein AAF198_10490 [Pseudomonadota bacterium]